MKIERAIELTRRHFLSAGETDAEGRMPLWLVISRFIEIATEHANILGLGYADLIKQGIGWVLTRMSVEMVRYPKINEEYEVTTWIEGYNRLYSDRCYLITDSEGNDVGYGRSMWVAIDMEKRTMADLTFFEKEAFPISKRECPVPPQQKMPLVESPTQTSKYKFRFCDMDFNRHVNTVQYVKHLLNQWDLDFYDRFQISRFEIAFHHECYFGEEVDILLQELGDNEYRSDIMLGDKRLVASHVKFISRIN